MQVCPGCGEENPDRFRVCGYCGTALATAAPPSEARKTVTIVFSDLVGSTTLGERLDPEALHSVLTRYFEVMTAVLERHGGAIQKFIGDAIVAVFGLPQVHEDDALRAVRAAHEMRRSLAQLNDELTRTFGTAIEARIGVNTGEIVAGEATTGQSLVTGDTANVAARLEQAAPAMEVFIGGSTYRLVRNAVEVEPMEPLELKGKADPVAAYRLIDVRATEEGVARRFDAPMVGRQAELAALRAAFGRAVGERRCHAVTLIGDAGVGKSRLIREFLGSLDDDTTVLRGRCLSYGEGITFWPLAEIVRQAGGLEPDEDRESALAKLGALAEDPEIVDRLASAIGLSDAQLPVSELFWGARRFLESLAGERALVVVIDDIHWAEPTFLDLLDHLTTSLDQAPVLLLLTARHELLEARPEWGEAACTARIVLEPLSPDEAGSVVANLLGEAGLPDRVRNEVIRTAGGNPLFVEQLLSMLIDDGTVRQVDGHWEVSRAIGGLSIPPSIHALLAARLDRLLGDERAVVDPAAVIGVEFPRPAVVALSPEPVAARIDTVLRSLAGKQLVQPAGSVADDYRFNHQLIRDATYQAMLKRGRATLHEAYAEWLLAREAERIGEFAEVIGYHLEQAHAYRRDLGPLDDRGRELGTRAAGLLSEAGRRAFAREDMHAAASLMRRAVDLMPPGAAEWRAGQLLLAESLDEIGAFADAGALLNDAEEQAEAAADAGSAAKARLLRLRLELASTPGPEWAARALREADRDLPVFEALGDLVGQSLAWRLRYLAHSTTGFLAQSADDAARIVALASEAGDERQRLRGISNLAIALTYGPTPAAEALQRLEALDLSGSADRTTAIVLRTAIAQLRAMGGEFDAARSLYRGASETATELGQRMLGAQLALGGAEIEFRADDPAAAQVILEDAARELEGFGETYFLASVASMLGRAYLEQADLDRAWAESERAARLAAADDIDAQARWRGLRARVLVARGEVDEAVRMATEAVNLTRDSDWPLVTGLALADQAAALRAAGRSADADRARDQALAIFASKGDLATAARLAGQPAERSLNPSR